MLGARVGIEKKALHQLSEQMSFSLKEVISFLSLPVPASMDDRLLDYSSSERIIKTAELYQKGSEVFGEGNSKYGWIPLAKRWVGKSL
jgi:hypothetical protein